MKKETKDPKKVYSINLDRKSLSSHTSGVFTNSTKAVKLCENVVDYLTRKIRHDHYTILFSRSKFQGSTKIVIGVNIMWGHRFQIPRYPTRFRSHHLTQGTVKFIERKIKDTIKSGDVWYFMFTECQRWDKNKK